MRNRKKKFSSVLTEKKLKKWTTYNWFAIFVDTFGIDVFNISHKFFVSFLVFILESELSTFQIELQKNGKR